MFLVNCNSAGFLEIIYHIKRVINLVFLLLPSIVIVVLVIKTAKTLFGENNDVMKIINEVLIKLFGCFLVMLVPTVVSGVFSLFDRENGALCWNAATKEKVLMLANQNNQDYLRETDEITKGEQAAKKRRQDALDSAQSSEKK